MHHLLLSDTAPSMFSGKYFCIIQTSIEFPQFFLYYCCQWHICHLHLWEVQPGIFCCLGDMLSFCCFYFHYFIFFFFLPFKTISCCKSWILLTVSTEQFCWLQHIKLPRINVGRFLFVCLFVFLFFSKISGTPWYFFKVLSVSYPLYVALFSSWSKTFSKCCWSIHSDLEWR